jgi:hypothetical protein
VVKPKLFIFSDDLEWCKKTLLTHNLPVTFVVQNTSINSWQDLILMSYCRHHIIANSSFSWWAAWLADQRYSMHPRSVIAPVKWFVSHNSFDVKDRFPDGWIII